MFGSRALPVSRPSALLARYALAWSPASRELAVHEGEELLLRAPVPDAARTVREAPRGRF